MAEFKFCVLVAGIALPEYCKDGRIMVESNLFTPVSYKQRVREIAYGEVEEQEWPVTPYQVRVETSPSCQESWFHLCVDGVEVNWHIAGKGRSTVFQGVSGEEGVKELLFALPRFARDEYDRVESTRSSSVGKIEVVQYTATFEKKMYTKHHGGASLNQANKKDAAGITKGVYIMSTSKEGRVVKRYEPYAHRAIWKRGPEVGRQTVEYHMSHTLQDMGIQLKQMDWSLAPALTLKVENVAPV